MNKILTIIGIFFSITIMVSAVTAVPQKNSIPILNIIDNLEQKNIQLDENYEILSEKLSKIIPEVLSKGIILNLILALINFLNTLVQLILNIMKIGNLILSLVEAITALFDIIMQFIEWLQGIFNPSYI